MQNDSNAKMATPESQFIDNMGLKKAKDVIQHMPEGAKYWVVTTGYHNDIPNFSQYKYHHLYDLGLLKKHIEEYEKIHGVNFGIPEYLLCEPRHFKAKLNHWHEDTCDLEFEIAIKCTDSELHVFNKFWSNHEDRLSQNNGDIVAVILKMIGTIVFWWCYEHNTNSLHHQYGVNSVFKQEGWDSDCFEITKISFENNVRDEDFEITPISVEG